MLGFNYIKVPPTTFVMQFRGGHIVRQGSGLSFYYFAPSSTIVQIPLASVDVPFVFNEVTADFQDATIQGELTYRIVNPEVIASLLDFSIDHSGRYRSDDPTKLNDRLVHVTQVLTRAFTQQIKLRELLIIGDELVTTLASGVKKSPSISMLGIEVLSISVLSIKPAPEMSKALQAEARELLLQQADEAVYARRNSAVELERQIKENELNTEIAVEQKRRQVRETQLNAEIALEQERAKLVERRVANETKEAKAHAVALQAVLDPLKKVDWRVLTAIQHGGLATDQLIAMAFRDLADNAGKIGQLNISPDLLQALLPSTGANKPAPQPRRAQNQRSE